MPTDARAHRGLLAGIGGALIALVLPVVARPAMAPALPVPPLFEPLAPFEVAIGYDTGRQAFTLADVNGDQRADLITAEPDEERVGVYLGVGEGAFELVAIPETLDGLAPYAVAVADVGSPFASDGGGAPDGLVDVLVGGDFGGVQVFYGRGDGQFERPEVTFAEDDTVFIIGMVAGEFDGESGTDVAVLDEDGVFILCNDRFGNLGICSGDLPVEVEYDPIAMVGGRFDGDDTLDLAVLDGDEQAVLVIRGNGDGTLQNPAAVSVVVEAAAGVAVDLAVGRMDDDPLDDLVAVNAADFGEQFGAVILGSASGAFRVDHSFVADFEATGIVVADFDPATPAFDAITAYDDGLAISRGIGGGDLSDVLVPFGPRFSASNLDSADLGGTHLADLIAVDVDGETMRVFLNRAGAACAGDCDGSGGVTIEELLLGVNIAIGLQPLGRCPKVDGDASSSIEINELIAAVRNALEGCR